jgi:hypothetical protein
MSRVALYVNRGRVELAENHTAETVVRYLSSPTGDLARFQLTYGGAG